MTSDKTSKRTLLSVGFKKGFFRLFDTQPQSVRVLVVSAYTAFPRHSRGITGAVPFHLRGGSVPRHWTDLPCLYCAGRGLST